MSQTQTNPYESPQSAPEYIRTTWQKFLFGVWLILGVLMNVVGSILMGLIGTGIISTDSEYRNLATIGACVMVFGPGIVNIIPILRYYVQRRIAQLN